MKLVKVGAVILFSLIMLMSCGEAGIETDISKITEFQFDILSNEVNSSPNGSYQLRERIDFASNDFEEYINDAKTFEIKRMWVQLSEYDETNPVPYTVDLQVDVETQGKRRDFFSANNLPLENSDRVLLYQEGNPINILTSEQIGILEQIAQEVLAQRPVDFIFDADFISPLYSDFKLTFFFEMVARVELK